MKRTSLVASAPHQEQHSLAPERNGQIRKICVDSVLVA